MNIESGTVSEWMEEKGFGFITPVPGGKKIFFHINDYSRRHKRPIKDLKVNYCRTLDQKGRECAIDVVPIKGHKDNGREIRQKFFSLILSGAFSTALFCLFSQKLISVEIIGLYGIMSIVAFILYAKDKNAANSGEWRTAENTLHAVSLLGGWPGAKIAQSFLRHKSKKVSFRITYWVTVLANCGALYWMTTPDGNRWINGVVPKIYLFVGASYSKLAGILGQAGRLFTGN